MKAKLLAVAAALALSTPALAQGSGGGRGPGSERGRAMRNFDPVTVVTVTGVVTAVRKVEGRRDEGMHVELEAADAVHDVHLGPASFLAGKSFEVKEGDELEVTGSKVQVRGAPALIAQSVKKGDTTLTLRDAQGVPVWQRGAARR